MGAFAKSLLVFLGAGLGANARYWLGGWIQDRTGVSFPWNTLIINVTGSLAMGIFMAVFLKGTFNPGWRLFLAIGVLGGYTTFSAFSYEAIALIRESSWLYAIWYILGSNFASIFASGIGFVGMRALSGVT